MHTIFIDGETGTTGLRIRERLAHRNEFALLHLPEDQRKCPTARATMLNRANVAILCLPDAAAREAVAMLTNPHTVVIDASTAHRTHPHWHYGFPEHSAPHRAALQHAKRIAVPGCHASGYIALVWPLVAGGLLASNSQLTCVSVTGYSGGGKPMIADYTAPTRHPGDALTAPRQYALRQTHKHIPEMQHFSGIAKQPVFCPIVADYDCGIELTIPLHSPAFSANDALQCYRAHYAASPIIQVEDPTGLPVSSNHYKGYDSLHISVEGDPEHLLLLARYDNLGKGASGAAVQCLNLALGIHEHQGLRLAPKGGD